MYGWQPEAFTDAQLNDTDNAFAQEAKSKLKDRLDPDYIGVTCDGEVGILILITLRLFGNNKSLGTNNNNNNNNKRQFVRRRNMSVDITRAPYRQTGNVVRDSSTETKL